MARAAKIVFVTSFLLLNFYLAWDSRLLGAISPSFSLLMTTSIQKHDIALWNYFDLRRFTDFAYLVTDLESLGLLIVVTASSAWLSRREGLGAALLRSIQVAALCLVAFEVELAVFDCPEFFIHVTDFQEIFDVAPWFSNAALLLCSVLVLGATTLLLNRSKLGIPDVSVYSGQYELVTANRRNLRRFLILFFFGVSLVAGGWAAATYGGVWQLSYTNLSFDQENGLAYVPVHMLTSYSECQAQLMIASALPRGASCSLVSLNPSDLIFVGFGGFSILMGLLALRKHPMTMTGPVRGFWWLLAFLVPLIGGMAGYLRIRGFNRAVGADLMAIGIETTVALALLLIGISLAGLDVSSACSLPVSPIGFWVPIVT